MEVRICFASSLIDVGSGEGIDSGSRRHWLYWLYSVGFILDDLVG